MVRSKHLNLADIARCKPLLHSAIAIYGVSPSMAPGPFVRRGKSHCLIVLECTPSPRRGSPSKCSRDMLAELFVVVHSSLLAKFPLPVGLQNNLYGSVDLSFKDPEILCTEGRLIVADEK